MSVTGALRALYRRRAFGIKAGLEMAEALMEALGRPERTLACIHVAGTNGKGSVCALLASILRAAGLGPGLYTSPHLARFNERIQVDGRPVDDAALGRSLERVETAAREAERAVGREATFFECATAAAFEHFRSAGVRLAVIETGMGGRLDATNVLQPLVSVVTRIELEHTRHLGADLQSIAGEKAGIIKSGRPVVRGRMPGEAAAVVGARARALQAPLVDVEACAGVRRVSLSEEGQRVEAATAGRSYGRLLCPLHGDHQLENLATVLSVVDVLDDICGLPVAEEAVRRGVAEVQWPGRFQLAESDPPLVVDGAHNPAGARALAKCLRQVFASRPLGLIAGLCEDKDVAGFLRELRRAQRVWCVPVPDERGADPAELCRLARRTGRTVTTASLAEAIDEAREWAAREKGVVCIAGSLFLVGQFLAGREPETGGEG